MDVNICVIGAGIIGLSTAVNLTELHVPMKNLRVTLIAEQFSPHTTGDGSGGLWNPHLFGNSPLEQVKKWGSATFAHALQLAKSADGAEIGCSVLSGASFYRLKPGQSHLDQLPFWKDIVCNFKLFSDSDMRLYKHIDFATNYAGFTHTTIAIQVPKYLSWLLSCFLKKGGNVIQRKIYSLDELGGQYDIVVNCTALGSYDLISDKHVRPVRGQMLIVRAPWIRHFTLMDNDEDENPLYIIPRADSVVLGGTREYDCWDTAPSDKERRRILDGCTKIEPSLKKAAIVGEWVGLRPCRNEIRLEKEVICTQNWMLKVVHNYGHGGSGVTLHWGCALEATDLVKQCVQEL